MFLGTEEKFSKVQGIINTKVGYCGGNTNPTTYEEVRSTNHAKQNRLDEKLLSMKIYLKNFLR